MRGDAVSQAGESGAAADDGTADTVVRNGDVQRAVVLERTNGDPRGRSVLDGVRERLARDEVRSSLDARGRPLAGCLDVDGNRRGSRQVAQRRGKPLVEPSRSNAGGDLPEVGDRRSDLRNDLIERRRENLALRGADSAGGA